MLVNSSPQVPKNSVIIPVHNSASYLKSCLAGLRQSTFSEYDCIVVDDASTDDSAEVAASFDCRVIRLSTNQGPSIARNQAARETQGDILFFIDADVLIPPDTLQLVWDRFAADPQLDALIGSYDDQPSQHGFLSQYKNLFHHYVHQTSRTTASTFWSGCGAIRREVFAEHGGFSEEYKRPAVEDIELGYRMRADGRKMLLDKRLQVKHLKAWTFWRLMRSDILDRGIPWIELILRNARMPNDLNVQVSQRISVVLVYLLSLSALALAIYWQGVFLVPLLCVAFLLISNYWLFGWPSSAGRKGPLAWTAAGLGVSVLLAYWQQMVPLIPALATALAAILVRHRFLRDRATGKANKVYSVLLGLVIAASGVYILSHLPPHPMLVVPSLLLLAVVSINWRLYVFLTRRRGLWFTLAAVPFHLLYHFYNGISVVAGTALYWWRKTVALAKKSREASAANE